MVAVADRPARRRARQSGRALSDPPDTYYLGRFIEAQSGGVYEQALAELRAGRKQSHWMWFIFPQHRDLGRSPTAKYYGLSGREEAAAYLAHPVLGPRWRACVEAVEAHRRGGASLETIFGHLDALKYGSSLEIFGAAQR